jgi:hypothetical protein
MRKTILTATALVLYSSAVMAQSTDSKSPASTGPAAQSDSDFYLSGSIYFVCADL